MISACQHGGVLDNLLGPVANGSKADPTRCHIIRLRFMQAVRARFDFLLADLQHWLVKEDNLALNSRPRGRRDGRKGRDADGDGLLNEKQLRKLARKLAKRINYDHSLSRDKRWELSMRLSQVQKKLGAAGIDKAHDEDDSDLTDNVDNARAYQFQTDSGKLREFNKWLDSRINQRLLEAYENNEPWILSFVKEAYQKGYARAYDQVNRIAAVRKSQSDLGAKNSFLKRGFEAPASSDKLRTLATRSFEGMKNLTQAMKSDLNRILLDGMANKVSASEMAKEIRESLDISQARAERIVRTEITHIHAEGQLDSFQQLNVGDVGVEAEWMTAGGACPACVEMSNEGPFKVSEAHGLIPYHPNCRCAWVPVVVTQNYDPDGHYDPDQPRAPRGSRGGGRWVRAGGGIRFGMTGVEDYTRVYRGEGGGVSERERRRLAKASHWAVSADRRHLGDKWANNIASMVGLPPPVRDEDMGGMRNSKGHHRAFDVVGINAKGERVAVEVKTIQKEDKVSPRPEMKQTSIDLKYRDIRLFKFKSVHMVVVDLRANIKTKGKSPPVYYHDTKITRGSLSKRRQVSKQELIQLLGGKLKPYRDYHDT